MTSSEFSKRIVLQQLANPIAAQKSGGAVAPKLLLTLTALCLGGALCCAYLSRSPSLIGSEPEQATLVTEAPDVDIGECEPGSKKEVSFRLVNAAGVRVRVLRVLQTCQCGQVGIGRRELAPDEETTVEVTWRIGGERGRHTLVIPVVYQHLPDGPEQSLNLKATADVRGDLGCTPDRLGFTPGTPGVQQIAVRSRANRDRVLGASTSHPSLVARWWPDRQCVEVRFAPEHWKGADGGQVEVVVDTDNPNDPKIRVPVSIGGSK